MKEKLSNIRLKDEPNSKINVIASFRKIFGFSMADTVKLVDTILELGEITASNSAPSGAQFDALVAYNNMLREKLRMGDIWYLVRVIREHFDCDYEDLDPYIPPDYSRKLDDATKEALAWRDGLSEKEQEMIRLIIEWETPIIIA